ncbi:MAG: hypothetical protein B6244_04160 [Candidatus Cloacimonetes bacterium 4572_55]|nr:MAG: hypothetical protein B6244_04160 [Candidatus Cloacimonetes bacterium 4572_55]
MHKILTTILLLALNPTSSAMARDIERGRQHDSGESLMQIEHALNQGDHLVAWVGSVKSMARMGRGNDLEFVK